MNKANYRLGQCLQLSACTNCQLCADVCPAVQAAGDGQLSALYRIRGLKRILGSRSKNLLFRLLGGRRLSDAEWAHFSQTVFRCSLCGRCQEVCPVGIHLKDLWLSMREDMVASNHFPKKIRMIKNNLLDSRNVFDEDNEERADWVEDMDDPPDDGFLRETAEMVYFTGCTAAYFPSAQTIPLALTRIFLRADVDFTLLGEDEWCCGFPLLGAGLKPLSDEFIQHNLAAVKERGAHTVVFACPSCYDMWKQHYPYRQHGLKIYHATQYLALLADQGRIPFKAVDMTVTYHDPCDLGRGAREFDAPRRVLGAIPGLRLVELPQNRENCTCCGGGGNLEMVDADLSAGIAAAKMQEILATGAEAVVTSCQQCVRTLLTTAKRNRMNIEVLDIAQLVQRALAESPS